MGAWQLRHSHTRASKMLPRTSVAPALANLIPSSCVRPDTERARRHLSGICEHIPLHTAAAAWGSFLDEVHGMPMAELSEPRPRRTLHTSSSQSAEARFC